MAATARASTDPITNTILIPAIDLPRHVGLLFKGHLPLSCLPAYLHEATHHWCFHTAVGSTAALLYLRARRALLLGSNLELPSEGEADPLEDYVRFRMFDTLYRPLSEGLACFGEFDTLPVPYQVGTTVMLSAINLFLRRNRQTDTETSADSERIAQKLQRGEMLSDEEIRDMDASIALTLAECRGGLDWVDRKANVIARPFTLNDGGYVLGYLMVKLLHTHAASQENDLRFTEPYLTYMRWFFYEDEELVNVLLSKGTRDISTMPHVVGHFVGKVNTFFTMDHRAGYRRFTQWLENADLRKTPDALEHALHAFMDRSTTPIPIVAFDEITLARREYICVGRTELPVVVGETGAVRFIRPNATAGDVPFLGIPFASQLPPGEYRGVVEFQISAIDQVMACVVSVEDEEPHVTVVTQTDSARREMVEEIWKRVRRSERLVGGLRTLFEKVSRDSIVKLCVEHCDKQATNLYRHVVMQMFDQEKHGSLEPLLIGEGLLAIFSPSQIELIAACSMAPTVSMPMLQNIVMKTIDATEADLRAAYERLSPLLSVQDGPDGWKQFLFAL